MASTPWSRRSSRAAKSSAAATATASLPVTSRPRASFIAPPLARSALRGKAARQDRANAVKPIGSDPIQKRMPRGLAACVDRNRRRGLVTHEYRLQHVRLELPSILVIQKAFGGQIRDQARGVRLGRWRAGGRAAEA